MLLINAKAGPSSIHGIGLIAQEFIPNGAKVWEFQPGFDVLIPEADLGRLSPAAREQVIYWAYFDLITRTFVLSSDDDRFANHSDEPNTRLVGDCAVATRDIQPGEEITDDYTELVMLNFPVPNHYGVNWVREIPCSR
jgi:SET domain-containing protein